MRAFVTELRRRRVLQIGGAYIAGAWLGAEVLNFLFEQFRAPDWTYSLLAIVLVAGFPVAMVLGWVVQIDDNDNWEIDTSEGGSRFVAAAVLVGVLATGALSWLLWPRPPPYEPMQYSIAVIPFPGQTEALYREVVTGLARTTDLKIVRLVSNQNSGDLQEIGESLGVAAIAFAEIDDGNIRISLLDVVNHDIVSSNIYDLNSALPIVNGILTAMQQSPLTEREFMGTGNADAYRAWLNAATVPDFEQIIDMDPAYVRAYVGLARALMNEPSSEALQIDWAISTARRLDPDSADAVFLLGLNSANRVLRIQAFEQAIELDPDHHESYYHLALHEEQDGDLDAARELLEDALFFDPMNERYRKALDELTTGAD